MIDAMALVGSVPEDAVHKYSIRPEVPFDPFSVLPLAIWRLPSAS
jgi:hypothetical protein